MKKDIKYAAAVESEAQTLETIKAASAAHDVQHGITDACLNAYPRGGYTLPFVV